MFFEGFTFLQLKRLKHRNLRLIRRTLWFNLHSYKEVNLYLAKKTYWRCLQFGFEIHWGVCHNAQTTTSNVIQACYYFIPNSFTKVSERRGKMFLVKFQICRIKGLDFWCYFSYFRYISIVIQHDITWWYHIKLFRAFSV